MTYSTTTSSETPASPPLRGLRRFLHKNRFRAVIALLVFSFIVVSFWDMILVTIPAGYQGVYWSRFFGGTRNWVIPEGTGLTLPWDSITLYDIRMKEVHQTTDMLTKDGMSVKVTWSTRFRPDSARLPELHKLVGPDFSSVLLPEVIELLRRSIGHYRADEIYNAAGKVNDDLSRQAVAATHDIPVRIDDVVILRMELPAQVASSIETKLVAEQGLLSYVFRLQAEQQESQRKAVEAAGIRDFERISGISILKWRGIDATVELSKSPNAKVVVMGSGSSTLPLLLNTDK